MVSTLEELASNELIKREYTKTFLLNMFRKICAKMNRDNNYKKNIQTLFRQTYNQEETSKIIIKREFNYDLSPDETKVICEWFCANLKKSDRRKPIPLSMKKELYKKQGGKCLVCGEPLDENFFKIHVDHIIPWILVGDELQDNYQVLCDTCNECKSAKTDYIFKSMINLV